MLIKDVWVIAEYDHEGLLESTLELFEEGKRVAEELNGYVSMVIMGYQIDNLVGSINYKGLEKIFYQEHPLLQEYSTDGYTSALVELIKKFTPSLVLISASPNGQDFAPKLAYRLDTGIVTDCVMVKVISQEEVHYIKPTHADRIYTTYSMMNSFPQIATIRKNAIGFEPPGESSPPEVVKFVPNIDESILSSKSLGIEKGDPKLMDITEADIVVAGGRGAVEPKSWEYIKALADTFGASVGGSRVAFDEGLIPKERMIGKTGKQIQPRLYLSAGISGSSYHIGGAKPDYWIAINSDADAPVLKCADLGIVSDLNLVIPALIEKIEKDRRNK